MPLLEDDYCVGPVVGVGNYGVVRQGVEKKTGRKVAIKTATKQGIGALENEIISLRKLGSVGSVLGFIARYQTQSQIHMVTEYCNKGPLTEYILNEISQRGRCCEEDTQAVVHQLLKTLKCVHAHGFCHRDIKPDNIMITGDSGANTSSDDTSRSNMTKSKAVRARPELRLIDFGLAHPIRQPASVGDSQLVVMDKVCGSDFFIAPEVFGKSYYGGNCDIWSVGVIMHIMLFGVPPFTGHNPVEIRRSIKHSAVKWDHDAADNHSTTTTTTRTCAGTPDALVVSGSAPASLPRVSSPAKNLLSQLLVKDPDMRMGAAQALRHCWFADLRHQNDDEQEQEQDIVLDSSDMSSAGSITNEILWSLWPRQNAAIDTQGRKNTKVPYPPWKLQSQAAINESLRVQHHEARLLRIQDRYPCDVGIRSSQKYTGPANTHAMYIDK